jgi:putative MATE family efflux protein
MTLLRKCPYDREILNLALPALGALTAEPLFLLVDSGIVGHLGHTPLAGLGAATVALGTLVTVCVFLAYGTTASVSRLLGADDPRGALQHGYDGLWLAGFLGVVLMATAVPLASAIVRVLGATGGALDAGATYLRISAVGLPAMLVVLAATGVLRGLHRIRTTLVVAVVGAAANAAINYVLVYPVGLGIAGSALGTVVTQAGMAATFVAVTVRTARPYHVSIRPRWGGIRKVGVASVALMIQTLALRVYLLAGTWVAASFGTVTLAAHGVASNIWSVLVLMLDAIAIAGQSLVGRYLGAADEAGARAATRRLVELGVLASLLTATVVLVTREVALPWFTPDAEVRRLLSVVLLQMTVFQPVCATVFVLDGVLIGAGDTRYLAIATAATTGVFIVGAAAVAATRAGLVGLWWVVGLFMLARLVALGARARTSAWIVTGGHLPTTNRPRSRWCVVAASAGGLAGGVAGTPAKDSPDPQDE